MKKLAMIFLAAALLLVSGCSDTEDSSESAEETATGEKAYATVETEKGTIKFEIFTEDAPVTASNFVELAKSGFYDGLIFHRVIRGFVIQGGDPTGTGAGGSGKNIPLEISPELKHNDGAVAMARSQNPDSASSQFYICEGAQPALDGNYAVFGQVTEGLDVVRKIEQGDKMLKITIS
ncbi:MAG: peptidylprolyl isomerase [Candidatus Woesearchaeota archaeon]